MAIDRWQWFFTAIPALLGALIGGATTLIGQHLANNRALRERREADNRALREQRETDNRALREQREAEEREYRKWNRDRATDAHSKYITHFNDLLLTIDPDADFDPDKAQSLFTEAERDWAAMSLFCSAETTAAARDALTKLNLLVFRDGIIEDEVFKARDKYIELTRREFLR